MSDTHAADPGKPGETPKPPGLPEIRDEAGDSPKWLPLVGLGVLLALAGIFGMEVWRGRRAEAEQARAAAAAAAAAQPAADDANAEGAAAPPPSAPVDEHGHAPH